MYLCLALLIIQVLPAWFFATGHAYQTIELMVHESYYETVHDLLRDLDFQRKNLLFKFQDHLTGKSAAELASTFNLPNNSSLTYDGLENHYYGLLTLGTPSDQVFKVIFDTASSDILVPLISCTSPWCLDKTRFNPTLSSSHQSTFTSFSFTQGSGTANGTLGKDVAKIAGISVANQAIGEITSMSGRPFIRAPADGKVGLGFNTLSGLGSMSIFESILVQELVDIAAFSFYFSPTEGELVVGGFNPSRIGGSISWLNLTSAAWWSVRMDGVQINSTIVPIPNSSRAIFDTSYPLIAIPTLIATAINQLIGGIPAGPGVWVIPCNRLLHLPNLIFTLSEVQFSLKPTEYIIQSNNICLSAITAIDFLNDEDLPTWIFGQAFLRSYYSIYEYSNRRVGLAPSRA